jgi:hypothetical protein
MTNRVIGRCSICNSNVTVPELWMGTQPPVPTCSRCGATRADDDRPVIPMKKRENPPQGQHVQMRKVLLALAEGYGTADHLGDVSSSLMHGLGVQYGDVDDGSGDTHFQRNLADRLRALCGETE